MSPQPTTKTSQMSLLLGQALPLDIVESAI